MVITKNGTIAEGDIVTIDYAELDADGNEMSANKRDDFTFTVGSSYNFYKLDKDLVGMKKGDEAVIEKTYDDESGMGSDYLGRTVKIKVAVKEVKYKEVPELDDDFAQDVKDEYKTVDDLLKATRKQLEDNAEEGNKAAKLDAVIKALLEKTEIDVPKSMVEAQLEQDWQNFISRFGMSEEDVLKIMGAQGGGKENFLETRRADTLQNIKGQLIIEQIKEEQKYEVSEDEIEAELKNYGEDINKDNPNYESMKIYAEDDVKYRKARDLLLESNTFKAVEPKEEKEEN